MIQFLRLLGADALPFRNMTFAGYGETLQRLELTSEYIAIGVVEDGTPIGLGVARMPVAKPAEIISIFIKPERWNQGLGSQLMRIFETTARERTCSAIAVSYTTLGKCVPAVEKMLRKTDWPEAETRMLLAEISPDIGKKAEWIQRLRIPESIDVFPWCEITPTEREGLEGVKDTVTPALWPFTLEKFPLEPVNSLGLRQGGEVIGWMICHRISPNRIRYTSLYVREPWRTPELSFALLAEAVRRKQEAYPDTIIASLAVQVENKPMLRVLERKLKPYAVGWSEMRGSVKLLN